VVYRESARGSHAVEAPSEVLLRIDVSGRAGADGRHGRHGSSGGFSGQDGQDGADATPAHPGQRAGAILVTLSEPARGRVRLTGERVAPDGSRTPIDETRDVGDYGFVDLVAMGGPGGHGGNGGDGGHGARGRRGSDATRYSSGGNGGPGGDGGSGGNATSGADGGPGGTIVVRVRESDTHLLMLLRRNVGGGAGGAPGRNGSGGSGGAGGSGGSSHSWTTTEHYTDAQGNSRTRTRWHHNPGGSSGPSGHSGRDGFAHVTSGSSGQDGRYAIEVVDAAGRITTYPERYDLRLISFDHVSENEDGIYEPGERVRVFDLKVRNVGGMPTPKHSKIVLHLRSDAMVHPEDETLELPRGLPQGHEVVLSSEALHFRLGDYHPSGPGESWSITQTVRHGAYMPAVERPFAHYETEGSVALGHFQISFPVEISSIECLRSLAAGQASALAFTVLSRSQRVFGVDGELGRALRFKLFFRESELGDGDVVATDPEGRFLSLSAGHVRDIPRLRPEEELRFEYTFGVTHGAEEYAAARVWISLELGHVQRPLETRPVQYRAHETRVARRYRHTPGARTALVVNHRTDSEVLDAWERAAAALGFDLDVLDLSYEGRFDPLAERDDGPPLLERIEAGSVVVLNDVIETPGGPTPASTFVDLARLRRATDRGLDVAFVGEAPDLSAFLPDVPAEPKALALDEAALFEAIADTRGHVDLAIAVHRIGLWFEAPTELLVTERARSLSERLAARFPARRFVVVYDHRPEKLFEGYVVRRWRAGTLRVISFSEPGTGRVLEALVDAAKRSSPDYPTSRENLMTLLLARGFDERIDLLAKMARGEIAADPARALLDAMLVDLAAEQESVLVTGFRAGLGGDALATNLPLLSALVTRAERGELDVDPAKPLGEELCRFVGRLRLLTTSQVRFWEWPLFFLRRSVTLRSRTLDFLERFTSAALCRDDAPDRKAVRTREAEERIAEVVRALKDEHRHDRKTAASQLLLEPIASQWLTADVERRRSPAERVLSLAEHDALARGRAYDGETVEALEEACANDRQAMLRALPGAKLRVAEAASVAAEVPASIDTHVDQAR
jgi:hypothetical protein